MIVHTITISNGILVTDVNHEAVLVVGKDEIQTIKKSSSIKGTCILCMTLIFTLKRMFVQVVAVCPSV